MNEKIEQCKADIAKLQAELKRLEDEAKPKPRHGDIVDYYGDLRIIVIAEGDTPKAYSTNGRLECGASTGVGVAHCYEKGYYNVLGNVFDREAE